MNKFSSVALAVLVLLLGAPGGGYAAGLRASPALAHTAAVVESASTRLPALAAVPAAGVYPVHTNIVSTTFWVGEVFNASAADGSQVCSTYNRQWAFRHTGVNLGAVPPSASACAGSIYGGCDGVSSGTAGSFTCSTEARTAADGYFPQHQPPPKENPFYLDLPFDDVHDPIAFQQRCQVIPWAAADNAATGINHCADPGYSYMKNRWVKLTGPGGRVCYGQNEDAGPSSGTAYHDAAYVFGANDARPANPNYSADVGQGAGLDVSPALNGCLGFAELNGPTTASAGPLRTAQVCRRDRGSPCRRPPASVRPASRYP
ncbi:hypothetical protein [Arthrobacter sp. B3I4]|uniref:hypothetical protein n=1 Tax=Arthrobacter sp. B3I4 TaxID=3042267 RepID=UPI002788D493|nr:hypothetical protein [Arthrobacter sp. B3I4]MDQ0757128.1 hypothetical protein [Arthrobacter sp. B3I4]